MKASITVELSKDELEELVREHFQKKGINPDSVAVNFKTVCTGYGPMESSHIEFKNISVRYTAEV